MGKVINIEFKNNLFLPKYLPLVHDKTHYDIDFFYGGRDSGKTRHIAMQLLILCMTTPHFKCLLVRKQLNTVRASQYSVLKELINDWGLKSLFTLYDSRLEIKYNLLGTGFFGRGLDDVGNLKSFNNPTYAWVEEGNQIDSDDFTVLLTTLRGAIKTKVFFSFNPECESSYETFWLYDEYFSHTKALSWTWTKNVMLEVEDGKGKSRLEVVEYKIRATHSTYKDNAYCPAQRRALYEGYKNSKNKAYWYQTYTLGLWGYRRTGSAFFKCFDETLHTGLHRYNPHLPIHISLDNNVHPYVTISIWQVDQAKRTIYQIAEIAAETPSNNAIKAGNLFIQYLDRIKHNDMVFIYGDPSANAASTVDREGKSFFAKFIGTLEAAKVKLINRVKKSAPSVSMSGLFVNEIYEHNYAGWALSIDVACRKAIEDYVMTKEDNKGKVLKIKTKDKNTKVTFEQYGHFTDAKRYFLCTLLENEYISFQSQFKRAGSTAA